MVNVIVNRDRGNALEVESSGHALISYRAIVAGLLISMFCMLGFVGLGLALGGMGMNEDTTAQSVGIFSGVWFIVSVLLSLFIGSYCASRFSKYRSRKIGSLQGLVIASLFLGFFVYASIFILGTAGSALGNLAFKSAGVIQDSVNQPRVARAFGMMAEDALGDLNLRSSPEVVAEGLGSRLIQGDTEGAKNYLARQTGITPTEATARIDQLRARFDKYVSDMKEKTGVAMKSTGWSIFLLVVLGAIASVGGGALGSAANFRKPLILQKEEYYPPGETV